MTYSFVVTEEDKIYVFENASDYEVIMPVLIAGHSEMKGIVDMKSGN